MKLLIITQAVDEHNTVLGFFTRWIEAFSERFESIEVICLFEGEHTLPANVRVHSLGKEKGNSRLQYVQKFFMHSWKYRNEYDVVFVHMNQEYIVLGGLFWKLLGKKIFFWRNHPYGNIWTRIAVFFSDRVFCTATQSFTARYKKTSLMPAGVDTNIFKKDETVQKDKGSLLVFGRIAPVKAVEKAIDATANLLAHGMEVELSIIGDALPRDTQYIEDLKNHVTRAHIEPQVTFTKGVDFVHAPKTYQSHEISLNFTESGSFDKTVIEALACGTKVLVSNDSMKDIVPEASFTSGEPEDVQRKIENLLLLDHEQLREYMRKTELLVQKQSLHALMDTLHASITNS